MSVEIKPVMVQGRIVYTIGDLFKGDVAKTFGTQHPKLNKQGQQYREYGFGLAVPKASLAQMGPGEPGEIWARIHEAAYTLFPNRQIPANFHMKWKDGDTGTNQDGTPLNGKEGYAGHIIFSLKTTFPIKFFKFEGGQHFQINEGIKCGDYVNVQIGIGINPGTNAGLYLNPLAAQFLGFGKEISNAPTASQIFGNNAPVMPQGASATPLASAGFITPPGGAPAPAAPHYGVLPAAHHPAPHQHTAPAPAYQPPGMPAYQPPVQQQTSMPPLPGYPR
jgi:hypothetical protein